MDRKKRYKKRLEIVSPYKKRETTTENVTRYILYPVVLSTINKSNDFYFYILKLCWNDKNILKDRRFRQMQLGMNLVEAIDTEDLGISAETGWFSSSRQNDLAKIGKIAGYFLRMCSYSVYQALNEEGELEEKPSISDDHFNGYVNALKLSKAVVPAVVKLQISSNSNFALEKFICLDENLVQKLKVGDEINVTLRAKLISMKEEFHDWAWRLLNTRSLDKRAQVLHDPALLQDETVTVLCPTLSSESTAEAENENDATQKVKASIRVKYPNKRYSEDVFEKY